MDFAKIMKYVGRAEFRERFDAAVAANERNFGDCAEEVAEETIEALEGIGLWPVDEELSSATAVLEDIRASGRHQALCTDLDELLRSRDGSLQVYAATIATATALLLAKTASPGEETKFLTEVHKKLAPVRALPALVELAFCVIDGELASRDSIRDRAIIDDALFGRRISVIQQVLDGIGEAAMTEVERIEATEKCPLMQAKRARQKCSRELVESGQCTLESMFFIPPEIARRLAMKRRTDDS